MRYLSYLICGAALLVAAAADAQPSANRFQEMDRNGDGVITRDEWRGNARSFANHDWNNDGVLSGDELRPGARRPGAGAGGRNLDQEPGEVTDWSERHFRQLDRNGDGRLSRDEWRYDVETFRRIDRDGDGVVSRAEFLGLDTADNQRGDRFEDRDTVGNQRGDRFEDRDTVGNQRGDRFEDFDTNRDGVISREEFARASSPSRETARSQAYRSGYERGMAEGRQAGGEDKRLRNQWDLDGQRELEQADSGYRREVGARNDYQTGYRAGFRVGYREGFGRR